MKGINLALRFLLELASIAGLAIWGWRAGGGGPISWVLAIGAPAVLVIAWGLFLAPKSATSPLSIRSRTLVGGVVMLVVAGFVAMAGEPVAAGVLAVLVVGNTAALFATGAADQRL
jgi:hypothetical protein